MRIVSAKRERESSTKLSEAEINFKSSSRCAIKENENESKSETLAEALLNQELLLLEKFLFRSYSSTCFLFEYLMKLSLMVKLIESVFSRQSLGANWALSTSVCRSWVVQCPGCNVSSARGLRRKCWIREREEQTTKSLPYRAALMPPTQAHHWHCTIRKEKVCFARVKVLVTVVLIFNFFSFFFTFALSLNG